MRSIAIFLTLCFPFHLLTGCVVDENDGCGCILDEDDDDPPYSPSYPTCGEELCPAVTAACDGYCETPLVVSDPDALECALTVLRDRVPGIVRWSATTYQGQYEEEGYLLIGDDGSAVRRTFGTQDLSYVAGDAVLGPLPDPGYFDACLAEADPEARFVCLRADLQSQSSVCDAGWSADNF